MKFLSLIFVLVLGLQACNSGDTGVEKDPAVVHPPSEAIPDSAKLVNDSVIMPDTQPNNGSQVGNSDSIRRDNQQ